MTARLLSVPSWSFCNEDRQMQEASLLFLKSCPCSLSQTQTTAKSDGNVSSVMFPVGRKHTDTTVNTAVYVGHNNI